MNSFDTEICALTSDDLVTVAGGAQSCAQFDFLGVHFNFEWDNTVKVTWWNGRESWRTWGR